MPYVMPVTLREYQATILKTRHQQSTVLVTRLLNVRMLPKEMMYDTVFMFFFFSTIANYRLLLLLSRFSRVQLCATP